MALLLLGGLAVYWSKTRNLDPVDQISVPQAVQWVKLAEEWLAQPAKAA